MRRQPPVSTRTYTLFPYTSLFRSVAVSTILVVPQGFAASGDAARSLLTLRGLNGARVAARVAAPFAIERPADLATVDLSGLAPRAPAHLELHWEASVTLTMPNPETTTALLAPRVAPAVRRAWPFLKMLEGFPHLS